MKVCKKCGMEKSIESFNKRCDKYYHSVCKKCLSEERKSFVREFSFRAETDNCHLV